VDQARLEEELNRILLKIAEVQDEIWDRLDDLEREGNLSCQLEDLVRGVMRDLDYWTDQCTKTSESPPILLRRMQIQLKRLQKASDLIKTSKRHENNLMR